MTQIVAPAAGELKPLAEVADPVFSSGVLGPGVAVTPRTTLVTAPVAGTVVTALPHAYGIRARDGMELLVHVGIETVRLEGRHFQPRVEEGMTVRVGDPLVEVELDQVEQAGFCTDVLVVVTNVPPHGTVTPREPGPVHVGELIAVVEGDRNEIS